MALLVPDNGGTAHFGTTSAGAFFMVIGPIPADRWIDLLYLDVFGAATAVISVGFTLGTSREANQAGFETGIPLIQRSNVTNFGVPMISFVFAGEVSKSLTFAVGRRISSGPSYIHIAYVQTGNVFGSVTVSARLLGLARETRSRLGEPEEIVLP